MNQSIPQFIPNVDHNDEEDSIDMASYIDFLVDNRWLITGIAFVITLLGSAYALMATPIYQANILLQVEDSATSSKNILGDLSGMFDLKTAATSEMEVLRSRFVVARAVENTHLYLSVQPKYFPVIGAWIARRSMQLSEPGLLGFGGYAWGAEQAAVSVFNIPKELENQRFDITAENKGSFRLSQSDTGINVIGKVGIPLKLQTLYGGIELLVDSLSANSGAQFRLEHTPKLEIIEKMQESLAIAERGKQSGIISVALEGADPQKTANTLNELGHEYIRQNVDRKSEEAQKSLAFLDKQLPNLKQNLEQAEAKYTELRNSRGTIDLGEEAKSVLQHSILAQTRLVDLKQKRDELLTRFQNANPLVEAVNQQIATITAELETINAQIKKLPLTEQDVFRLTRDVKVNTDLYTALLNSAQQLRLIKASKVGNARLLDIAVTPLKPIRPNRGTIIALAILIGLLSGVFVAFVRKTLFGGVTDPHEVEQRLGLKVSATIPYSMAQEKLYGLIERKSKQVSVLVHDTPTDPAVESLRSFRTSLQFSMLDAKNNIVMVTGPTPGIGKSFISANFAAVLAMTDKKILLVDADLRKGYLQRYFGLERNKGLSDVIAGQLTWEDAVHKSVIENVDFISTGALPPRPAELLGHKNFVNFLHAVSSQYDIVLIDTSPVLAVSDALVVAPHVGTIFNVVRGGTSSMGEIEETIKRLKQAGCGITGIVFNGLKARIGQYGYGSKYGKYRYTHYKY